VEEFVDTLFSVFIFRQSARVERFNMQTLSIVVVAVAVLCTAVLANEDPTGKLEGVLDLSKYLFLDRKE
jgi:Ca2+/H+ antiporter